MISPEIRCDSVSGLRKYLCTLSHIRTRSFRRPKPGQEKPHGQPHRQAPSSLARFDPLGDIDDLSRGGLLEGQSRMQSKVDMKEDDKAVSVHTDIPGVKIARTT